MKNLGELKDGIVLHENATGNIVFDDNTFYEATIKLPIDNFINWIASLTSDRQASFVNKVGKHFRSGFGKGNHSNVGVQISYIVDDLDEHGEWLISEISEFIKLKKGGETK